MIEEWIAHFQCLEIGGCGDVLGVHFHLILLIKHCGHNECLGVIGCCYAVHNIVEIVLVFCVWCFWFFVFGVLFVCEFMGASLILKLYLYSAISFGIEC